MAKAKRFQIVYHSRIKAHLHAIDRRHYTLIRQAIEEQLSFEPEQETRNRKPVVQPFLFAATWEIRFGPQNGFRVFYDVDPITLVVSVLAIGEKKGNRLLIGGEEVTV